MSLAFSCVRYLFGCGSVTIFLARQPETQDWVESAECTAYMAVGVSMELVDAVDLAHWCLSRTD